MRTTHVSLAGLAVLRCCDATAAAADGPYRQLKEIAIGGEGGWDYLSVDTAARRLYVSHATKVVGRSTSTRTPWSVRSRPRRASTASRIAPELGRGFVSNGRARQRSASST